MILLTIVQDTINLTKPLITLDGVIAAFAGVVGLWLLRAVTETRDKVRDIRAAVFGTNGAAGISTVQRDHENRLRRIEGLPRVEETP